VTRRVSARLSDETARALDALESRTGQRRGDIVRAALRAWLERPSAAEVFAATGFVGSGEGPSDLARNAKKYLREPKMR
jgi:predicted transcriptional regulator